ncbi:MAG: hypothetical protein AABW82_04695 [Nanoarchaeota archaeon]
MSVKKSFGKYWALYVLIAVLVVFLFFKLNDGFITGNASLSSDSLSDIITSRTTLQSSFDSLKTQYDDKKGNYQACITNLIGLYADTDAREDPAHQQAISTENERCQDLYNEANALSSNCNQLEGQYTHLLERTSEYWSNLNNYFNQLSQSDINFESAKNEKDTAYQFINQLERDHNSILYYCQKILSLRDPCTALSSQGEVETDTDYDRLNDISNNVNPDTEAQVIIDSSNPDFVSDSNPSQSSGQLPAQNNLDDSQELDVVDNGDDSQNVVEKLFSNLFNSNDDVSDDDANSASDSLNSDNTQTNSQDSDTSNSNNNFNFNSFISSSSSNEIIPSPTLASINDVLEIIKGDDSEVIDIFQPIEKALGDLQNFFDNLS